MVLPNVRAGEVVAAERRLALLIQPVEQSDRWISDGSKYGVGLDGSLHGIRCAPAEPTRSSLKA
jgi:hypothetical protein